MDDGGDGSALGDGDTFCPEDADGEDAGAEARLFIGWRRGYRASGRGIIAVGAESCLFALSKFPGHDLMKGESGILRGNKWVKSKREASPAGVVVEKKCQAIIYGEHGNNRKQYSTVTSNDTAKHPMRKLQKSASWRAVRPCDHDVVYRVWLCMYARAYREETMVFDG